MSEVWTHEELVQERRGCMCTMSGRTHGNFLPRNPKVCKQHLSSHKKCPQYIFRSEIVATQARQHITYREAEEIVRDLFREEGRMHSRAVPRTYSRVVSQPNPNVETTPVSTPNQPSVIPSNQIEPNNNAEANLPRIPKIQNATLGNQIAEELHQMERNDDLISCQTKSTTSAAKVTIAPPTDEQDITKQQGKTEKSELQDAKKTAATGDSNPGKIEKPDKKVASKKGTTVFKNPNTAQPSTSQTPYMKARSSPRNKKQDKLIKDSPKTKKDHPPVPVKSRSESEDRNGSSPSQKSDIPDLTEKRKLSLGSRIPGDLKGNKLESRGQKRANESKTPPKPNKNVKKPEQPKEPPSPIPVLGSSTWEKNNTRWKH